MRLRSIRLVEQTEQKFRRIRVCLEEKEKSFCGSRALLLYKASTTKRQSVTGIEPVTYWKMTRRANQQ